MTPLSAIRAVKAAICDTRLYPYKKGRPLGGLSSAIQRGCKLFFILIHIIVKIIVLVVKTNN